MLLLTGKHWLVETGSPIELRDKLELWFSRTPVNCLHCACVPAVNITGSEDDLGFRVSLNELLCKGNSGPIANGLAVAGELVPLLATELALAVVLRCQSVGPHEAVRWVLDRGGHHVIAVREAQFLEGSAEGSSSSSSKTQCQDSHWHHAATFSAVDVGVGGEDVGDWLRGVGLESHGEGWCVVIRLSLVFAAQRRRRELYVVVGEGQRAGATKVCVCRSGVRGYNKDEQRLASERWVMQVVLQERVMGSHIPDGPRA